MSKGVFRVAAIQLSSGEDKKSNIERAVELSEEAAGDGAQLIALPETFDYRGNSEKVARIAEEVPGAAIRPLMELARQHSVWVLAGSIHEKGPEDSRPFNCSLLINPNGAIVAKYRKIHLFDMWLEDSSVEESRYYTAGDWPVVSQVNGLRVGLSICYDVRFPELYRRYAQEPVDLITIPSAFTAATGEAHWEVLVRARAIESQCFVLAPNQYKVNTADVPCYGNSMIVDPWGRVLARGSSDHEETLYADLNLAEIGRVRSRIPALQNRRL